VGGGGGGGGGGGRMTLLPTPKIFYVRILLLTAELKRGKGVGEECTLGAGPNQSSSSSSKLSSL